MKSKKSLLKNWKIYPVLESSLFSDTGKLLKKFRLLLESPVDAVQLRFESFSGEAVYRAAKEMVRLAKKKNISLIINDRPEVALSLGADGVHLGKSDIPASLARKLLGRGAIIGRTIRNEKDLRSLSAKDVDYVSIGPIFKTPTKPQLKAVGLHEAGKLSKRASIPLVAIGGINKSNVREVASSGIKTVAFVRYGIKDKGTRKRIIELRKTLTQGEK